MSPFTSELKFNTLGKLDQETRIMNDSIILYKVDFEGNKVLHFTANKSGISDGDYELLEFYANGLVKSKSQFRNDQLNGKAYYFYKSGVIKHERNWENGKKIGLANDFFDTTGALKAVLLYNLKGELYYKKSLNRKGGVVKIEGEK